MLRDLEIVADRQIAGSLCTLEDQADATPYVADARGRYDPCRLDPGTGLRLGERAAGGFAVAETEIRTGEECVIAPVSRDETVGGRSGEDAGQRRRAGISIGALQGTIGGVFVVRGTLITGRRKEPADLLLDRIRLIARSNRVPVAAGYIRRLTAPARLTFGRRAAASGEQDSAEGNGTGKIPDRDHGVG